MRKFKDISIRHKISVLVALITTIAVTLGLIVSTITEARVYKNNIRAFVTNDANMISDYCIMPLEFGYPERVSEILENLRINRNYQIGAVYDVNNKLFAFSSDHNDVPDSIQGPSEAELIYFRDFLEIYEPIYYNEDLYGTVYLKLKTGLHKNIRRQVSISVLIILGILIFTIFLTQFFQRSISTPILNLASIANNISKNKDYTVRLKSHTGDEIGVLYDNFNQMLEAINLRENERNQATSALIESEENFRNIFNNSSDGILLTNIEGEIIEVNNTICSFLDLPADKMRNMHIKDISSPEYMKERNRILELLKSGESITIESTQISGSGDVIPVESNSRIIKYKGSKVILSTVRNITERKKAEEALRYETTVNKALADISKETIRPEMVIEKISTLVHRLSKELTNSKVGFVSHIAAASNDNIINSFDGLMFGKKMKKTVIILHKSKEGYSGLAGHCLNIRKGFFTNTPKEHPAYQEVYDELITLKNFLSVPAIANNRLVGQIAVGESPEGYSEADLEAIEKLANIYAVAILRKQTTDELIEAKEKAEESDELKSAFLANMSHEIRTPMNGIIGFADLLQQNNLSKESVSRYIDIIDSSANRLLNIINDIIDISKIETGIIQIENSDFALSDLCKEIYSFFEPQAKKHGIFLKFSPETIEDIWLSTDRLKISQIISNLMSNAIKFTHKGEIILGYKKLSNNGKIDIYVKDTGIGIAKEYQEEIFDRFRQVEIPGKRKFGGTGLGLAISKAFADALGAKLIVDSLPGKGSTFHLHINYKLLVQREKKDLSEIDEKDEFLKGHTILIVEDEEINYLFLEEILTKLGAKIIWAQNGLHAIQKALEHPELSLILMDIKLPVMDGFTAARKIKEYKPDLPIIAQTAYGLSGDKEKTIAAGCDDYISKPIVKKKLFSVLLQHLSVSG